MNLTTDVDDEEDEIFHLYEKAQWYWDDKSNQLKFKSDNQKLQEDEPTTAGILGPVEFRQDIDLCEQQRFRKRYQRKHGPDDVVTLQDVKDIVFFTAPLKILTPKIIKLLHLSATERLMRACLLYCQYYLQVTELLKMRSLEESKGKIRTPTSDQMEDECRRNLECIRLIIGKEYCAVITGSGEFRKYHHMGRNKKAASLLKKDRLIFETFLRILIQVIWITLGYQNYKKIELEIHRIFKSDTFNLAQHNLDATSEHQADLTEREAYILNGSALQNKKKVKATSPIMDEVHCVREVDYRLYGVGVIRYPRLDCIPFSFKLANQSDSTLPDGKHMSARLRYLEQVLTLPEINFKEHNISLGILGFDRNEYDIMLNKINKPQVATSVDARTSSKVFQAAYIKQSAISSQKKENVTIKLSNIQLPAEEEIPMLEEFPHGIIPSRPCDKVQRAKWLHRAVVRKYKHDVKPEKRHQN